MEENLSPNPLSVEEHKWICLSSLQCKCLTLPKGGGGTPIHVLYMSYIQYTNEYMLCRFVLWERIWF